MTPPPSSLRRPRLPRPRLLPVTIVAMSTLLTLKSVVLMQAIAGEPGPPPAAAPGREAGRLVDQTTPGARFATPAASQPHDRDQDQATPPSEAERAILLDLRHRRLMLDARARDLDQRQAELAAADRRLADRVQQLASLQSRLEALEASRQQHSAENWAGLVKVYEAMKPREAAAIFDVLDMQVLLQVLDRMQERRAAAVLAAMQPDRARLATQMLAELRTRAVTPASDARPKG